MKIIRFLLFLGFLILIISLSLNTSADFNQDLGRHLKLGEIIVKTGTMPKINLFSYTYPNFPFINHHWLSEVIFYQIVSFFGLNSLLYLKVFLILLSVAIVVKLSIKKSGFLITIFSVLIFSPLLLERSDIRPELFAYLLFSALLYIILTYPKNKKLIYLTPLIMVLWINLHVSFVFGILLIFLLIIKILSKFKVEPLTFNNALICLLSLLILLINPSGLKGILYPFLIFKNYGYTIVENQNLFLLNQLTFNPLIKYFFLISPITIISIIILFSMSRFIESLLLTIFFALAVWQIRHFPFFVLTAIPTVSIAFSALFKILKDKLSISKEKNSRFYLAIFLLITLFFMNLFFITNSYFRIFDINKQFGLSFNEDAKNAVEFLEENNLPKNIFNNFDIGGYLIYKLYPRYTFFVDNRPEAYPADFLQNIYINLQQDQNLRKKIFQKYNINTIFFSHTDQTPWGQTFIKQVLKDNEWSVLYVDSFAIVLTKNGQSPDLRSNKKYFYDLIAKEDNYLKLLRLFRLFIFFEENDLAQKSFLKAKKLNPLSCAIKRILFREYQNSPYFYQANEIKNNSPYCF